MGNEENRTTELALGEMQLIRPTSEFKVGHLPFQGKVKCKTTQPRCARETFL